MEDWNTWIFAIEKIEFAVQKTELQLFKKSVNLPNFYSCKHAQTFFKWVKNYVRLRNSYLLSNEGVKMH